MHHNNFGNFYTREIYAILIPIGFIPISIPIPIMSCMAIPIPMGFPWEWDSHGVSHSHAPLVAQRWTEGRTDGRVDTRTHRPTVFCPAVCTAHHKHKLYAIGLFFRIELYGPRSGKKIKFQFSSPSNIYLD